MLEKVWIANDKGRLEAIWVQRDLVSPVKCDSREGTKRIATESLELPTDPLRNDVRISAAFRELQTLRVPARHSTPLGSSKGGNWTRFYTILRSVLP